MKRTGQIRMSVYLFAARYTVKRLSVNKALTCHDVSSMLSRAHQTCVTTLLPGRTHQYLNRLATVDRSNTCVEDLKEHSRNLMCIALH